MENKDNHLKWDNHIIMIEELHNCTVRKLVINLIDNLIFCSRIKIPE